MSIRHLSAPGRDAWPVPPAEPFALYALPAIFLNPIGEEILFRGFIQGSLGGLASPAPVWW